MTMKKCLAPFFVLTMALGITACSDVSHRQDGPLTLGASDGKVENTFCGIFRSGDEHVGIADIAVNESDTPLWITSVQAVSADQWEATLPKATVLPVGDASLYGWTDSDLSDAGIKQVVDHLKLLDRPLEVEARDNVLVALEGVVQSDTDHVSISQLQVTYKTDLDSSKSFTVLGNIEYIWKTNACE